MNAVAEVMRKEVVQLLRTRRLMGIGIALALVMVGATVLFPYFVAPELGKALGANGVLALFLQNELAVFSGAVLLQVLAVVLAADAISGEWAGKTLFLLLSKPVSRPAMVVGKYLGLLAGVCLVAAALLVVDFAVLALLFGGANAGDFALGLLLVFLGMASFVALGLGVSAVMRTPGGAILTALASSFVLWVASFTDNIIALSRYGVGYGGRSAQEAGVGWADFLSPGTLMEVSSRAMAGQTDGVWGAVAGLVVHIAVWLTLAFVVVLRRDFQ